MPMLPPEPSCGTIGLEEMLERREARVVGQQAVLERYRRPAVSLTLVNPGPVKDTQQARFVFQQGVAALDAALADGRWNVLARSLVYLATGPEALHAVDADPIALKRTLVALEDRHPLGRLWDADVIAPSGAGVSRQQLGLPPRRCLVCIEPAHACARSGTHALAELQCAIADMIDAYCRNSAA